MRKLKHVAYLTVALGLAGSVVVDSDAAPVSTHSPATPQEAARAYDSRFLTGLQYRHVGPYRGGRSTAVAGVADDIMTYYMGTTGGGVWKTADGGQSWQNR